MVFFALISKAALAGVFALVAWYSYSIIYNLFLSPISHVQGPFFSKISSLPSWYHALKGDRHLWIWRNLQIYGEKCRIAPEAIVFASQAHKDIYNYKANVTRAQSYEAYQKSALDVNTFNTSNPHIHRRKRRLLNLVFTEKAIRAAGDFVCVHVDRWNELLLQDVGKEWSAPKNLAPLADYLLFDIMGDLSFGVQFDTKEPGKNRFKIVPPSIHRYMIFLYPIMNSPLLPFVLWAKPRGLSKLLDAISPPDVLYYQNFVDQAVNDRCAAIAASKTKSKDTDAKEETPGGRQDMFHFLHEVRDPDTGAPAFSKEELRSEASLLIVAGSDTTSVTLTGFFFFLTRNPRAYAKAVAEVRSTFASANEIKAGTQLSSCKYLRACLDESMRLSPSGPSELPRQILEGGQVIAGEHYPQGIVVGTAWWCNGRNDELGDPFIYRPERWIADEEGTGVTEEDVTRLKQLVHPFSSGPANCVGQNLAILELLIITGRTLWRMDVRAAPGESTGEGNSERGWGMRDPKLYNLKDAYISVRDGPVVQFRARD